MKNNMQVSPMSLIQHAQQLISDGSNFEYDRALIELIHYSTGMEYVDILYFFDYNENLIIHFFGDDTVQYLKDLLHKHTMNFLCCMETDRMVMEYEHNLLDEMQKIKKLIVMLTQQQKSV